jgi:hypothetical protein
VDVVIDSVIVFDVGTLVEVIIVDVVSVDAVSIDVVSVVDRSDIEYVSTLETKIIAVSDVVVGFHSAELFEPDIKSLVKLDVDISSIVVVSTEEVLMVRCEYCEPVSTVKVEPVDVSNPIEDPESVEAVELGTERLDKANVDSNSVEDGIVVENSDSRSVSILELVESVERDMRIVEPPVVSSGVDAVLTKVDTVADDVDSPNWGDEELDVTVVLRTSCKVSRAIL